MQSRDLNLCSHLRACSSEEFRINLRVTFCLSTSPGQTQMKKQPSISSAGDEMTVASHSVSVRTVKASQPGGVNSTFIARTRNYYSTVADSFHCCLLWSSKYTDNCISLYWEMKLARTRSLAFRVRIMAYLESAQLNCQPPAWDGFSYAACWGTGQSHIGGCQQLNSACGPPLEPTPRSCVICFYRHGLWVPGTPGEQQNQSWLGQFFESLDVLEALAVSLPDQTPLSGGRSCSHFEWGWKGLSMPWALCQHTSFTDSAGKDWGTSRDGTLCFLCQSVGHLGLKRAMLTVFVISLFSIIVPHKYTSLCVSWSWNSLSDTPKD